MSDKYKITGEEINQILMHSPHALSLTPSERGMSGEQIKRFFYDFIKIFAEKLNLHLGDVGGKILTVEEGLAGVQKQAANATERAEESYNLARGKTRVHVEISFGTVFGTLEHENVNEGDLIMVTNKGCPDFVVASGVYKSAAEKITKEMVVNGKLPKPEVGGLYYYELCDKTLIAIESGVETGAFATIEYVDGLVGDVSASLSALHEHAQLLIDGGLSNELN